jgi:thiaminase/transcriptional activator TenA
MSLAHDLRNANLDIANETLHEPFIQGIASGTLPRACYYFNIRQNSYLIETSGRVYSIAAAKAPDWESFIVLNDLAAQRIRERQLNAQYRSTVIGDTEPAPIHPTTHQYTDFLISTIWLHDSGMAVVAMTALLHLFDFVGKALTRDGMPNHQYTEWLKVVNHPVLADLITKHEHLIEQYASDSPMTYETYRYSMWCDQAMYRAAWEVGQATAAPAAH